MADEWNAVVSDLHGRRMLTPAMSGVIATYITALWSVQQAQKAIEQHGAFVLGADGAMKPNPATGLMSKAQETIARLSGELGLTPSARSRKTFNPPPGNEAQGDLWAEMDI